MIFLTDKQTLHQNMLIIIIVVTIILGSTIANVLIYTVFLIIKVMIIINIISLLGQKEMARKETYICYIYCTVSLIFFFNHF